MSNILTTELTGGICDVACCPPIWVDAAVATPDGWLVRSPGGGAAAVGCGAGWAVPLSNGEVRPGIP